MHEQLVDLSGSTESKQLTLEDLKALRGNGQEMVEIFTGEDIKLLDVESAKMA